MFKSRGSLLYFDVLHVQIFITKYSGGHENVVQIIKNAGGGWQLGEERVNVSGPELEKWCVLTHLKSRYFLMFTHVYFLL